MGDELSLIRKPHKSGGGLYSAEERTVYFTQVMQHEFFHRLYRSYADFQLESKDHQWFDRSLWPKDFEGLLEPDYYAAF